MSSEPRSLHVLASNARRGAEVFALDLVHRLREIGHEANAVAVAETTNSTRLDVPVLGGTFSPRAVRRLRGDARGADVIVAHGSRSLPAVTLAGPKRVPFIYRSIGDPRHWSAAGLRRMRTGFLLRRAATIVVLWPAAAEALIDIHGIAPGRIRVIPNAVSGERFTLLDDADRRAARLQHDLGDGPVVAWIGALSAEKDPITALRAVSHLEDVTILFAGDGPQLRPLKSMAEHLGMSGRVRFLGSLEDPRPVLAAADALLLTSRTEGLPAVLIEAGLSGLPCVATDVGGVGEIVIDDETGRLVAPGDDRAAAQALRSIVDDPGSLGGSARRHCLERFELARVAHQWADLIADFQ